MSSSTVSSGVTLPPPPFVAEPLVFGLGNPLLDLTVTVPDSFLEKKKLVRGAGDLYNSERHGLDFFNEIECFKGGVMRTAGSATLNTIRVLQGLLNAPGSVAYAGCVGDDDDGKILSSLTAEQGVRAFLVKSRKGSPTGLCATLINGNDRTMVTKLSASNDFTEDDFSQECWTAVEKVKVVYSAGFHLTVCPTMAAKLAKYCAENGKLYMTSLSAGFIPEFFGKELEIVLDNCDVLFGNEMEFAVLGKAKGISDDPAAVVAEIAKLPFKDGEKGRERLVICTQGAQPTIVASSSRGQILVPVAPLDSKHIIDTTGAGDAFTAGFIYAVLKEGRKLPTNLTRACEMGHRSAQHVIQRHGCAFDFTDDDRSW